VLTRKERPTRNLYWIPEACRSHEAATAVSDGHLTVPRCLTDLDVSIEVATDGEARSQPRVEKMGGLYLLKLVCYNVADQERASLGFDQALDDDSPTWPTDAKWITLVRCEWRTDTPLHEDQSWIRQPYGRRPIRQLGLEM
jgi:hypothetical protein